MSFFTTCRTLNFRLFSFYVGILLSIPALTIAIEYLIARDPSFRQALMVNLQDFHVYQLFTSSFVHENFDHFLGNVSAYLLIIVYGFVLSVILNRTKLYLVLTKVIVVVFLVFGAVFTLFTLTTSYYAGLSGIDAALAGLLLIFWLMYIEQESGRGMHNYHGIALAVVILLFMGIIGRYLLLFRGANAPVLLSLLAAFFGILVLCVLLFRKHFKDLYSDMKGFGWSSRFLSVGIVLIFWYFIWNIFPERLANSARAVSISLHLGAIVLGILAGYFCMVWLRKISYFHDETGLFSGPGP